MPTSHDTNPENPSAAIRLITQRGEGLLKVLGQTYPLASPVKSIRSRWDYHLSQLFRTSEPHAPTHHSMTSMSLIPQVGRMELVGNQSFASCGVLYDLRLCDLRNEKFIFMEDAVAHNAWFFNLGTRAQDVRININLEDLLEDKLVYNEIRAGINAKAVTAIVLQPPVSREENVDDYYMNRCFAVQSKVAMANKIDRHIPIIILHATTGPEEYTFAQQQLDLKNYLKTHPHDSAVSHLNKLNDSLGAYASVEFDLPGTAHIVTKAIQDEFLLKKIKFVGDKVRIMHLKHFVSPLDPQMETLNDLYEENNNAINEVNAELADFRPRLGNPLVTCLRHQEDVIDQIEKLNRRVPVKSVQRNFLQRNKNEIIGAGAVVTMVIAVAAISVVTLGSSGTLGIAGILIAAFAGGTAFGLSALEITKLFHNNRPMIKSALESPLETFRYAKRKVQPEVLTPQNFLIRLNKPKNDGHKQHHGMRPRGVK